MRTAVETITPEKARQYLKGNRHNRKVSKFLVESLAREISDDLWMENGETIVFNNGDRLLDGQHRLHAVIKANKPIRSVVVRGAPTEAFQTIDTGKKRNAADVLGIAGHEQAHILGGALPWVGRHLKGDMRSRQARGTRLSNVEALRLAQENPELKDSVDFVVKTGIKGHVLIPGAAVFLHWLLSQSNKREAREFVESLLTGSNMRRNSPVYYAHHRLAEAYQVPSRQMSQLQRLATCVKAWNMARRGESAANYGIRWKSKGQNAEPFPTPV